jgi:hypothetical protein
MGKFSRDKGAREERAIVNTLREHGIDAERVPLSGAAGGSHVGDILIGERRAEAKLRASGFRNLYEWLERVQYLFVRADRREQLVVMRESEFLRLLRNSNP